MSDTLRVDQAMTKAMQKWKSFGYDADKSLVEVTCEILFDLSKSLERELNAANEKLMIWGPSIDRIAELEEELNQSRKDTARLDWISTGDGLYHLTRAEIDKAMQRELLIEKLESDDRDERKDQYEMENNDYE
jgi:hypothetical protein